jgi:cyanophycinase
MRQLAFCLLLLAQHPHRYYLTGNATDITRTPIPAFALIGGGEDVDEISRWFATKANGGDLLILRATGTDAYNPYFYALAPLNSAQTLIIDSKAAAADPFVLNKISRAEAIFLAGGDQWNYLRLWNQSSTGDALRSAVNRGVPFAGTSAGLAVLGEYIFTAEHDTVTSQEALANPYNDRVQIGHDFLHIPALRNTITDSHFSARNRMGRTLVFLARMLKDFHLTDARAIAIDERTATLLEPDGKLQVAGLGHVYFLRARKVPEVCTAGQPLTISNVEVDRLGAGDRFDTASWIATGGPHYILSVQGGKISSNQSDNSIY